MTVHPGFGGQSFIDVGAGQGRGRAGRGSTRRGLALDVEVDGGIDHATAPLAVAAGANVLVAGSAIFGAAVDPLGCGEADLARDR